MGESLLIKTAKNLLPLGIHLRHSNVSTHEDFNCHTFEKVELDVQFKSGPGSEYKAMLDEKNHEGIILFLFEAAVRLIDPSVNEDDDGFVKAEISAFFEAEYEIINPDEFNEDGMSQFLIQNVPIHVWPYWREYVQSTCARIGIPEISTPFRFKQTQPPKDAPVKKGKAKKAK